jgi:hypothetical protein
VIGDIPNNSLALNIIDAFTFFFGVLGRLVQVTIWMSIGLFSNSVRSLSTCEIFITLPYTYNNRREILSSEMSYAHKTKRVM